MTVIDLADEILLARQQIFSFTADATLLSDIRTAVASISALGQAIPSKFTFTDKVAFPAHVAATC